MPTGIKREIWTFKKKKKHLGSPRWMQHWSNVASVSRWLCSENWQTLLIAQFSSPLWAERHGAVSLQLTALPFSTHWSAGLCRGREGLAQALSGSPGPDPGCWVDPDHMARIFSEWCQLTVDFSSLFAENGSQGCRTNCTPATYRRSTAKIALAILPLLTQHTTQMQLLYSTAVDNALANLSV